MQTSRGKNPQPDSSDDQPVDELREKLWDIMNRRNEKILAAQKTDALVLPYFEADNEAATEIIELLQAECNRALAAQRQALRDEVVKAIGEDEHESDKVSKQQYPYIREKEITRNELRLELRKAISTIFEGKEKTNGTKP